ncbi:hypothetical protein H0A36_02660 [Endozoicomonas sp. SM1973]|uniref:Uncharacterized protein n=1 Tax=Spartinivicinus marinus TaxID=2994442 RepID=A0A853I0I5_9GAMM|nr:hypothetical protein [Spartinivicinus marinus]MCX4029865.1 hypothetical protein [Spartinivicinus marinus]NYZ64892.1 hypothetical protein [Spartinivicinus marinus]
MKLSHYFSVAPLFLALLNNPATADQQHHGHILAGKNKTTPAEFDILHAKVVTDGAHLVFQQEVRGKAGVKSPQTVGKLAGSEVYSYVWPTKLNSSTVGFEADQGMLALALTVHPDFDDTPLYDEDGDGNKTNDGDKWHSHWVVLVPDNACGKGALKVKDIAKGTQPKMPATWPELPIFIDSPGYDFDLDNSEVLVRVPLKDLGFPKAFNFDGVTAGLKVNQQVHAPLLCVNNVFDVASGNLSLPGISQ